MKKKKLFYSIFLIIIFAVTGCTQNSNFKFGHSFYKKKNYVIAINFYDKYIKYNKKRANATVAELERSSCYYHLGLKAIKKERWTLAKDFFFLANSESADTLLDNCYFELAKISLEKGEIDKAMEDFDYILKYLPKSELIPEILYNNIVIYLNSDDKEKAYERYDYLCSNFPNNKFVGESQKLIDRILNYFIAKADSLLIQRNYDDALKKLLYIEHNPSKYKKLIKEKIAHIYIVMGKEVITQEKYVEAKNYFEKAAKWNPTLKGEIDKRLLDVVDLFIGKGERLIKEEKLDEAIKNFRPVFDIIPDYQIAKDKIEYVNKLKKDFADADSLYAKAQVLEESKKFTEALVKYKKSYKLHKIKKVKENIVHMQNIIRAKKEPKVFAKELIFNYKKGLIVKNLSDLEKSLRIRFKNEVKVSGWKIFYSFGKYKYEVRYDINTFDETYYFIWRVNLETRTISPLNKISKEYMGE